MKRKDNDGTTQKQRVSDEQLLELCRAHSEFKVVGQGPWDGLDVVPLVVELSKLRRENMRIGSCWAGCKARLAAAKKVIELARKLNDEMLDQGYHDHITVDVRDALAEYDKGME